MENKKAIKLANYFRVFFLRNKFKLINLSSMCIYQCSYLQCAFIKFVEAMGVRGRNGNDRLRTIWTPEMDRFFIALLLEQVSKGNKFDDHLFSKRAWKHMTSLFNAKFRFQYEKDVLKNRHKTLRNLFKAVKKLLDQKGFSWDENRQMVTADNNVWDEYIKVSKLQFSVI